MKSDCRLLAASLFYKDETIVKWCHALIPEPDRLHRLVSTSSGFKWRVLACGSLPESEIITMQTEAAARGRRAQEHFPPKTFSFCIRCASDSQARRGEDKGRFTLCNAMSAVSRKAKRSSPAGHAPTGSGSRAEEKQRAQTLLCSVGADETQIKSENTLICFTIM